MPQAFLSFAAPTGRIEDVPLVAETRRWMDRAAFRTDRHVVGVMLEVSRRLAAVTPVLSGQLLGNWVVTLNVPSLGYVGAPDPGRAGFVARAEAALANWQPGDRVFLANSTPYLPPLEYGTTRIAPRAFVRGVMAEVPAIVQEQTAKVALLEAPEGYFARAWRRARRG